MYKSKLVNAILLNKQNPETFQIPSEEELNSISEGTSIKVCADIERFWVTVTSVNFDERKLTGVVDNDLIFSWDHGYRYGDQIEVLFNQIYDVL